MSRRAALPERTPTQAALDHLTDPGTPAVSSVSTGNGGNPVSRVDLPVKPRRAKTSHVRMPEAVLEQLRDAVWYLAEHGRPHVLLLEVMEEAATAWLEQAKAEHTGGKPFPRRGSR